MLKSGLQPLCAVYRRAAKSVIEQSFKPGDFKMSHIFPLLPTRYVSEAEIQAAGFLAGNLPQCKHAGGLPVLLLTRSYDSSKRKNTKPMNERNALYRIRTRA